MSKLTSNKQILGIALPLILGSLGFSLVSATDTLFLGRTGDTTELAAIGLMSPFYLVVTLLGLSFSRGGQILIARRLGENQLAVVGSIFRNMLFFLLASAVLIYLGLKFNGRYVISLFIDDLDILNACEDYLRYRVDGIFAGYITVGLIALYSGIGRTKVMIYSSIVLAVVNIFLNFGLIFGNFGMPAMGIEGAGLASTIAEVCAMAFFIGYVLRDKEIRPFRLFKSSGIDFENIRLQLTLSTPIAFQSFLGTASWVAFFGLIEDLGEQALAVSSVIRAIYVFLGVPAWGLASATNTIVSNLIGEHRQTEVLPTLKKITILSIIITAFTSAGLLFFPEAIVQLVTIDAGVIQDTIPFLQLLFLILMGIAIYNIYFNGIVGVGAIKVSMSFQVIALAFYLCYIHIILNKIEGNLFWAWGAEFVYAFTIILLSIWYLRSNRWLGIKL